MTRNYSRPRSKADARLLKNHDLSICQSFIVNGLPLMRGTKAWDDREDVRTENGSRLVSYGKVVDSLSSNGIASLRRHRVSHVA